jgi:hypothetical protein
MEQNIIKAGQENFTLPHDVVQLPTGGVFYKNKKRHVKVGYLTANDENVLIGSTQQGRENLVLSLLRNKLYEPDLKPEDLLDKDVEAILIFLRNTSFGPEYNFKLTDPNTTKQFDSSILLDELNIKQGTVPPNEDGTFTTVLPKTNAKVKLKPLTFGDTIEIEKMSENYPAGRVAPKVSWRLNKQIVELNDSSDRGQISMFIETLPIMDSKYIRTFLNENVPSLDLNKKVYAPSGEIVDVDVNFGVDFFRPFF